MSVDIEMKKKEHRFIEATDDLKRHLMYTMVGVDESIVSIHNIKIRNTLDSNNLGVMYCSRNETSEFKEAVLNFFRDKKYELDLDITKNVQIVVKYGRHMAYPDTMFLIA